jgi:predicted glycosyl hydrolase (DUF1957 family)
MTLERQKTTVVYAYSTIEIFQTYYTQSTVKVLDHPVLRVQIVLGWQVFSTVFSIRRGIAPAGSFVCESLLPPGLANTYKSQYRKYLFSRIIWGIFFRVVFWGNLF